MSGQDVVGELGDTSTGILDKQLKFAGFAIAFKWLLLLIAIAVGAYMYQQSQKKVPEDGYYW